MCMVPYENGGGHNNDKIVGVVVTICMFDLQ